MLKANKVLVPVDLSGNSGSAIEYASELAKTPGSKIYLFHAAIVPDFYVTGLEDYSLYDNKLKSTVKRIYDSSLSFLHGMRDKYFDADARVICKVILSKNIYNEILDYSKMIQPDLIIMGDGEKSNQIKIGANTERVLRLTYLPVLIVKKITKASKLKKIVFASDFSKDSVQVFAKVNNFLQDSHTSIRLLYINTKSGFEEYETVKSRIEIFKKNFSADFNIVIRAGKTVEKSILRYANSINADLITMGIKRKKGLSVYFTDRITESVINMSEIPILAIVNRQ